MMMIRIVDILFDLLFLINFVPICCFFQWKFSVKKTKIFCSSRIYEIILYNWKEPKNLFDLSCWQYIFFLLYQNNHDRNMKWKSTETKTWSRRIFNKRNDNFVNIVTRINILNLCLISNIKKIKLIKKTLVTFIILILLK